MESITTIFAGVISLMKAKFGLQLEQVTGDLVIKVVTNILSDMAMTPFQKAQRDYRVNQVTALYAQLSPLVAIAQPSTQQQDEINTLKEKVATLERELVAA